MAVTNTCRPDDGQTGVSLDVALEHLRRAERELAHAHAEEQHAEHEIEAAIAEIKLAQEHRPKLVEIKIDQKPHQILAGEYLVSALKAQVGVASDRELDELKGGALLPLEDTAMVVIHGCEVFVSHVRTGSSA